MSNLSIQVMEDRANGEWLWRITNESGEELAKSSHWEPCWSESEAIAQARGSRSLMRPSIHWRTVREDE